MVQAGVLTFTGSIYPFGYTCLYDITIWTISELFRGLIQCKREHERSDCFDSFPSLERLFLASFLTTCASEA